jgi:hypothetical protein
MRLKQKCDYRITSARGGKWEVYDLRLRTLVAVFDSPLDAAEWARERLIAKAERTNKS